MVPRRITLPATALLVALGVQPGAAAGPPPRVPVPVIVTLVAGDHHVALSSTPNGVRYSVIAPSGELLAGGLEAADLELRFPAVCERIRSAIAGWAPGGDVFIWAGR